MVVHKSGVLPNILNDLGNNFNVLCFTGNRTTICIRGFSSR